MTVAPYIEAPSAIYLREYWRMIYALRSHYPMFIIPCLEFNEDALLPVVADVERWTLVINPTFKSNPRYHLIRELTVLLTYHASGKFMNPRYKLYREIRGLLEAA